MPGMDEVDHTDHAEYDLLTTDSGNAVVVALDHGIGMGAVEGFENPTTTLEAVLAGEPDGVLVGPHFARHYTGMLAQSETDVLVTADFVSFSTLPGGSDDADLQTQVFGSDLLQAVDPEGVKAVLAFGRTDETTLRRNVEYVAKLAEELRGTGIPLIIEPVMWGQKVPDRLETEQGYVANASRIAWELGADVLKLPYTGNVETFQQIVESAPVPTMILGGPASDSITATLSDVAGAMDAGARGVIMGRSVWQTDDPKKMVTALREIVHGGVPAEEAG
jgi:DhnA family fructose-bisphosphate aldolase class Ia